MENNQEKHEQVREKDDIEKEMPPDRSDLEPEKERQLRSSSEALKRLVTSINSVKSDIDRPMYLITQHKGRQW